MKRTQSGTPSTVSPSVRAFRLFVVAAVAVLPVAAQQGEDLAEASLEELMNTEISSVSKKAERLHDAPAAVFVVTADDIRRAGAHTLAEALRMVPGMEVARIDANKTSISARGFGGRFANKLLVLIDGRAVYTPTFSGTYWDVQDVPLFDVERIEVIRGPGATLWGANAVNGVINVITKKSEDTQGGRAHVTVGDEHMAGGTIRYGGRFDDQATFRAYGKGDAWDDSALPGSPDGSDAWEKGQLGLRIDWSPTTSDRVTFSGDSYLGEFDETSPDVIPNPPFLAIVPQTNRFSGWNTGLTWTRSLGADEEFTLAGYYDATRRETVALDDARDTFDLSFQHRFKAAESHELTWGFGYRLLLDDYRSSYSVSFAPASRNDNLFSAFIQDKITIVEDALNVTVGAKFEHNDYTGFEVQPSARLSWRIDDTNTLWSAVSRAVRTPSRSDHNVRINLAPFAGGPTGLIVPAIFGDEGFDSEELIAYEIGFRTRPAERLSLDLALFYNDYDKLATAEPGTPFLELGPGPPHLVTPLNFDNLETGETYGFEIVADWRATDRLRFIGSYSFIETQLHAFGDLSLNPEGGEGATPEQHWSLRTQWTVMDDVDLDLAAYWTDDIQNSAVDSYLRLDARLAWRPSASVEVAIGVQNLLDASHPELAPGFLTVPTEVERLVYAEIFLRF